MGSSGKIKADPLFVGLTRPTLIFGVGIQYAMVNMLICLTYFINSSDFKVIPIAFVVHMIGYVLYFKEPRFMELYINKFSRCNQCTNRSFHGGNSYLS